MEIYRGELSEESQVVLASPAPDGLVITAVQLGACKKSGAWYQNKPWLNYTSLLSVAL